MTAYALTLLLLLPGLDVITVLKWENNSKNALLIMGSLSVAYYTIALISLDLLRPALLSETKNTRCGETGGARSHNLRLMVEKARFELAFAFSSN